MHHIGDFQSLLVAYGAFTIISLSIMPAINEYGRGTRFPFTHHVNFSVKFQSWRSMPYFFFFFCFCKPEYRVSISNNLNENLTSHATSKACTQFRWTCEFYYSPRCKNCLSCVTVCITLDMVHHVIIAPPSFSKFSVKGCVGNAHILVLADILFWKCALFSLDHIALYAHIGRDG